MQVKVAKKKGKNVTSFTLQECEVSSCFSFLEGESFFVQGPRENLFDVENSRFGNDQRQAGVRVAFCVLVQVQKKEKDRGKEKERMAVMVMMMTTETIIGSQCKTSIGPFALPAAVKCRSIIHALHWTRSPWLMVYMCDDQRVNPAEANEIARVSCIKLPVALLYLSIEEGEKERKEGEGKERKNTDDGVSHVIIFSALHFTLH